eukprot:NODE_263_length_11363_cov_0.749556.p3 type:complete len:352 gc:universal NODE_263_length_11363_cov_0.749556:9361-10416(+)
MDAQKLPFELLIKCIPHHQLFLLNKPLTNVYFQYYYTEYTISHKYPYLPTSNIFNLNAMIHHLIIQKPIDIDFNQLTSLKSVKIKIVDGLLMNLIRNEPDVFKQLAYSHIVMNITSLSLYRPSNESYMDHIIQFKQLKSLLMPKLHPNMSNLNELSQLTHLTIMDIKDTFDYNTVHPFIQITHLTIFRATQHFINQCLKLFPNVSHLQFKLSKNGLNASNLTQITHFTTEQPMSQFPPNLKYLKCIGATIHVDLPHSIQSYGHVFYCGWHQQNEMNFIYKMMEYMSFYSNILIYLICDGYFMISNQLVPNDVWHDVKYRHIEILNGYYHYYKDGAHDLFHKYTQEMYLNEK